MGSYLSKRKRKPSTIELLEELDKDIVHLEKSKQSDTERQKRVIASLIIYSVLFYFGSAFVFYFYYMPTLWIQRVTYSFPLLIFPFIVWLLKRFLHWYYVKRLHKNDEALEKLKEKKKKILEDVMETETYKKAKEILEKFSPAQCVSSQQTPSISDGRSSDLMTPRVQQGPPCTPSTSRTSLPVSTPAVQSVPPPYGTVPPQFGTPLRFRPPGPHLPRPVLPRERSFLDRFMEYLIGDGPQNRYALICSQCRSHNGMALREEFEFLSFRCCYCFYVNEARRQRPRAPSLETTMSDSDRTIMLNSKTKTDPGDNESPSLDEAEDSDTMQVGHEADQVSANECYENLEVDGDVVEKDILSKKSD